MCFIKALLLLNLSHMSMSTPDLNWKNNVYLQYHIGMETSDTKINAKYGAWNWVQNISRYVDECFTDLCGFLYYSPTSYSMVIRIQTWFFLETKNHAISCSKDFSIEGVFFSGLLLWLQKPREKDTLN